MLQTNPLKRLIVQPPVSAHARRRMNVSKTTVRTAAIPYAVRQNLLTSELMLSPLREVRLTRSALRISQKWASARDYQPGRPLPPTISLFASACVARSHPRCRQPRSPGLPLDRVKDTRRYPCSANSISALRAALDCSPLSCYTKLTWVADDPLSFNSLRGRWHVSCRGRQMSTT
jgi:hypothetical protein